LQTASAESVLSDSAEVVLAVAPVASSLLYLIPCYSIRA